MRETQRITSEAIKDTDQKEFILRDLDRITIGRYNLLETNHAQRCVMIRLRFYKEDRLLLRAVLKFLASTFLFKGDLYKLNILVADEVSTVPFTELGYTLEGILVANRYEGGQLENEYLFGTDATRFNQLREFKLLALEGTRVKLSLASPEKAEEYLTYYRENREFLKPFEPQRPQDFYSLVGQRKALDESFKQYLNGLAINFGVYLEGKLIGKVQLSNLVYGGLRSAHLGYALHRDYEGRGLMKEALEVVIQYAFDELLLHRLEASTLLYNEKSKKVLKALGFTYIGRNEKYLYINGQWQDHDTFALIKKS